MIQEKYYVVFLNRYKDKAIYVETTLDSAEEKLNSQKLKGWIAEMDASLLEYYYEGVLMEEEIFDRYRKSWESDD